MPSVVIVGRPNVGKSTLFNAIIGRRRAIVGDEPGMTRDRLHGEAVHAGRRFEVIDTGGIVPRDQARIPSEILRQARFAIEGARHIVLVADGRAEITAADRELAALLRQLGKPVSVAVNKIDSGGREALAHEFYALGFPEVFPVSAEHRRGLGELLDHVTAGLEVAGDTAAAAPAIKVAIVGRPNVGKSTLLNALAGAERAIVSPEPGTTRDAVDERVDYGGGAYIIVDTAGIRRKGKTRLMAEKLSVVMARKHIRLSHVALCVLDAEAGFLNLDATIAGYAVEEGRAVILCVNKWDLAPDKNKQAFLARIRTQMKFLEFAPVVFLSAKTRLGVKRLFPLIQEVYQAASRRVGTGELNRFVETLKEETDVKLLYMTQTGVRPPTFVCFTDQPKLHFSTERFLINRLRERFRFRGTPVVLKARSRHGPQRR